MYIDLVTKMWRQPAQVSQKKVQFLPRFVEEVLGLLAK